MRRKNYLSPTLCECELEHAISIATGSDGVNAGGYSVSGWGSGGQQEQGQRSGTFGNLWNE